MKLDEVSVGMTCFAKITGYVREVTVIARVEHNGRIKFQIACGGKVLPKLRTPAALRKNIVGRKMPQESQEGT